MDAGGGGRGQGVEVTKGWRHRSATRMIVEGYSGPELTVSGEECAERRWSCGSDAIGYRGDIDDTVDAFITDDIAMGDEGERDWYRFPVPGPGPGS